MPTLRQVVSSQWPAGASALLHGGVVALLLWHASTPIVVPDSGQVTMAVDLVMVETPAVARAAPIVPDNMTPVAEASATDPLPEPTTEAVETAQPPMMAELAPSPLIEEAPTEIFEEPPPPIEKSVAAIIVPPPSSTPAKPERPVARQQTVPPPKPTVSSPLAPATPTSSALDRPTRPALALPPPGAMMMSEQALASPIVPPVPVGPPIDYVGQVRAQLERFKQYPRVAQQRRLQGEVMLSIIIDSGGRVLTYRLIKGSGHEILDREVAELVKRASPLPPIPTRLKTDRLEIVVPIEFSLQG